MSKIMPLALLSSIRGAKESKAVTDLFDVIKNTPVKANNAPEKKIATVNIEDLREDIAIKSSTPTKCLIKENFPAEKEGYLVVPRVIA